MKLRRQFWVRIADPTGHAGPIEYAVITLVGLAFLVALLLVPAVAHFVSSGGTTEWGVSAVAIALAYLVLNVTMKRLRAKHVGRWMALFIALFMILPPAFFPMFWFLVTGEEEVDPSAPKAPPLNRM